MKEDYDFRDEQNYRDDTSIESIILVLLAFVAVAAFYLYKYWPF